MDRARADISPGPVHTPPRHLPVHPLLGLLEALARQGVRGVLVTPPHYYTTNLSAIEDFYRSPARHRRLPGLRAPATVRPLMLLPPCYNRVSNAGGILMFATVQPSIRTLDEQLPYVGTEIIERLLAIAEPLRGCRVLNLSVSPFGTSVAETLHNLVPLLQDLGIQAEWQIVGSDGEYAHSARALYQGLSGRQVDWNSELADGWSRHNRERAQLFDGFYDAVIVHDPQPAGLPAVLQDSGHGRGGARWAWHCHLDIRSAQPDVWASFAPYLDLYDVVVFSDDTFFSPGFVGRPTEVIRPAIDPASPRNSDVPPSLPGQLLARYGLDPMRPLMVQVAPLDPAFGPMEAIEIFRHVRGDHQGLQLMLVHPIAESSLDAWSRFEKVARHLGSDPDAKVLVSQGDGGQTVVNAAQRAATVVLQHSVPAGFACQVWEAQWKGKPVVVGAGGGLPRQLSDGETGYVADSEAGLVEAVSRLLADPSHASALGEAGRCHVRRNHLITRLVEDELRLIRRLVG
jgi:trehalose synthase